MRIKNFVKGLFYFKRQPTEVVTNIIVMRKFKKIEFDNRLIIDYNTTILITSIYD
ncbi:hypothetical protein KKC67_00645 [Patescibacteria group bacterium]|nr:hypothetical protein [Patescibacteria group bacterium]MBU0897710.1 hypothetical protein [Patescibacteria group bacterium]MBU1991506.1 hypothetical protein [Patescibacteria group bacterium]MBU2081426.1 hypothetical protein [Patescibacteria group bacterium]MBU2214762.1 hypothetical protein [Patescibacteria group bacterium]